MNLEDIQKDGHYHTKLIFVDANVDQVMELRMLNDDVRAIAEYYKSNLKRKKESK